MSEPYPPILKMPSVPFEIICKKLDPLSVFSFSLSSIISNFCIRNYGTISAVYIEYQITKDITKVIVSISDKIHVDVSFRRLPNQEWSRHLELLKAPGETLTREVINGITVLINKLPGNFLELYHNHTNSPAFRKRFLKVISDKIRQIFPTDKFHLTANQVPAKTLFNLLKVLPRKFEVFECLDNKMMLRDDNMRKLLENYEIERMDVHWKTPDNFRYAGPLTHRYMEIFHGTWLTIDSILQMECIQFQANYTPLTLYDCNRFLKSWYSGGFLELQKLDLYLAETEVNYDFVLSGVPWHPFDSELRPRDLNKFIDASLKPQTLEITNGMDILRSDGKLATVYLKRMIFEFYVWN